MLEPNANIKQDYMCPLARNLLHDGYTARELLTNTLLSQAYRRAMLVLTVKKSDGSIMTSLIPTM